MNTEQAERYSRHIMLSDIGEKGQEKLLNSSVLVVGAGGLGAPVLHYLVAAGVGHVVIADHDVVSLSNLQRQVLYTHDDLDKLKVKCAERRLKQLNPDIQIEICEEGLTKENASALIEKVDVVVGATDNFASRLIIDAECGQQGKPFVHGSVGPVEGQVSVFHYQNGPAYKDLFPEVPDKTETMGVFSPLPGIIGSMQAMECMKVLLNSPDVLSGKLLIYNSMSCNLQVFGFAE